MTETTIRMQNFVNRQLLALKDFDERLIKAFLTVNREDFLPPELKNFAYADTRLRLKDDRKALEPMVLALMLDAADIDASDFVLNVGIGYGFSAAVIARLATAVLGTEYDADIARQAEDNALEKQIDNLAVFKEPLNKGFPGQAPYNLIIINEPVRKIEPALTAQLADGGRLLAPLKKDLTAQVVMIEKSDDRLSKKHVFSFVQ